MIRPPDRNDLKSASPVLYFFIMFMVIFIVAVYAFAHFLEQDTKRLSDPVARLLKVTQKIQIDEESFFNYVENNLVGIPVTLTAYSPSKSECDDTPHTTASMVRVTEGIVALSRDLEAKYCLSFGDLIMLEGLGVFQFQDRMNKRIKNTVDIFFWDRTEALKFGRRQGTMYLL